MNIHTYRGDLTDISVKKITIGHAVSTSEQPIGVPNNRLDVLSSSASVLEIKFYFFGFFDLDTYFLDNEKYFSGWPNRYFDIHKITAYLHRARIWTLPRCTYTTRHIFFSHQSFSAKMQHNREKPDDDLICKNDSCLWRCLLVWNRPSCGDTTLITSLVNVWSKVVGVRHFSLVCLLRVAEYILYTYLLYHLYTLCIYTTIYIFIGSPAMTKGPLASNYGLKNRGHNYPARFFLFVLRQARNRTTAEHSKTDSSHQCFTSGSFLAEISVSSPRKLFNFII